MYVGLYDRAHPLPTNGLDLTYITSGGSGDGGDQYPVMLAEILAH
jgi:hypothetical protein